MYEIKGTGMYLPIDLTQYPWDFAPYVLLALAMISTSLNWHRFTTYILAIMSVGLAYHTHHITWIGIGALVGATVMIRLSNVEILPKIIQFLFVLITFAFSLAIMTHQVPGFSNWLIIEDIKLTNDAVPIRMFLNFDKAFMGLMLLMTIPLIYNLRILKNTIQATLPAAFLCIPIISCIAYLSGLVAFDLKWPDLIYFWFIQNLLFVTIPEEVIFRGFLQRHLQNTFGTKDGWKWACIGIPAAIHGGLHLLINPIYGGVAFICSLFYGYVYFKTDRIESSIFLHMLVNFLHIIFFTYPFLSYSN